jgi:hypothetical protein
MLYMSDGSHSNRVTVSCSDIHCNGRMAGAAAGAMLRQSSGAPRLMRAEGGGAVESRVSTRTAARSTAQRCSPACSIRMPILAARLRTGAANQTRRGIYTNNQVLLGISVANQARLGISAANQTRLRTGAANQRPRRRPLLTTPLQCQRESTLQSSQARPVRANGMPRPWATANQLCSRPSRSPMAKTLRKGPPSANRIPGK